MDSEEEVVICRATDDIRGQDEERRQRVGMAKEDCDGKLQRDDAENNKHEATTVGEEDGSDSDGVSVDAQAGVQKIEATTKVWSTKQVYFAYAL